MINASTWRQFASSTDAARAEEVLALLGDASFLLGLLRDALSQNAESAAPGSGLDSEDRLLPAISFRFSVAEAREAEINRFVIGGAGTESHTAGGACGEDGCKTIADGLKHDEGCPGSIESPSHLAWWPTVDLETRSVLAIEQATGWAHKPKGHGPDFFINIRIATPKGITESSQAIARSQDADSSKVDQSAVRTDGMFSIIGRAGRNLWKNLAKKHCVPQTCDLAQFNNFRSELIVEYDVSTYPFATLFSRLFELFPESGGTTPPEQALAHLHEKQLTSQPLFHLGRAFKLAGRHVPGECRQYNHLIKERLEASEEWLEFIDMYRRFVREVCAPLCGSAHVVFQCPPTIRIALPGAPATIQMHKDADYPVHWAGEVNFWLPMTSVFESNTLWLESVPGLGDFRPMTLHYGQLLRFNGYQCRHYTVRNETSSSRVSFDWRAIPTPLCGERPIEKIGDYPAERT